MRLNHETSSLLCGLVWLSSLLENNKIEKCWLLVGSLLRIGRRKNVDCWSAHCYALADGKSIYHVGWFACISPTVKFPNIFSVGQCVAMSRPIINFFLLLLFISFSKLDSQTKPQRSGEVSWINLIYWVSSSHILRSLLLIYWGETN